MEEFLTPAWEIQMVVLGGLEFKKGRKLSRELALWSPSSEAAIFSRRIEVAWRLVKIQEKIFHPPKKPGFHWQES